MIKTKELIEKVSKLGFDIECHKNPFSNVKSNYDLITISLYDKVLVEIWANCQYAISTISEGHSCYLDGYDVEELYKLCFEYTSTPVEDREEEKRFYLRHKWLRNNDFNYLCFDENYQNYTLSTCYSREWKMQFTAKEIEKLKEKFNTNLEDFEMVEVEE